MKQTLEIQLLLDAVRGLVGGLQLDQPAGEIDAEALVLEVVEGEGLLAAFEDVPEVLHPHAWGEL